MQERLVEAGLVLLGHEQHLVLLRAETLRQLLLADARGSCPTSVYSTPGTSGSITVPEKATSVLMSLVALLGDVPVEGLLVPHGVRAGWR